MRVKLTCEICGKAFERHKAEAERNAARGRKTYCSRSCSGKALINNIPAKDRRWHPGLIRRAYEFSMFRVFLGRIRGHHRDKDLDYDVTLKDLKEQWDKQEGVCPYTGWKLVTPKSTKSKRIVTPNMASVDRIDPLQGYMVGNIQFVSYMANIAKNRYSDKELLDFCKAVATKHGD